MNIINTNYNKDIISKMSNLFKTNSRFASLIDDIPQEKKDNKRERENNDFKNNKYNSFKNDRDNFNRRNSHYIDNNERDYQRERQREEREIFKRENEEKEKERKIEESLSSINFPELVTYVKKDDYKNDKNISYIEKLKKVEEVVTDENNIDPDLAKLKPGWMLIKRDISTGKIIIKENIIKSVNFEKTEKQIAIDIMNKLVNLHEKRTKEYIELYGYDTWEKMFKFPNWEEEENYFDDDEDEDEDVNNNDDIYTDYDDNFLMDN